MLPESKTANHVSESFVNQINKGQSFQRFALYANHILEEGQSFQRISWYANHSRKGPIILAYFLICKLFKKRGQPFQRISWYSNHTRKRPIILCNSSYKNTCLTIIQTHHLFQSCRSKVRHHQNVCHHLYLHQGKTRELTQGLEGKGWG